MAGTSPHTTYNPAGIVAMKPGQTIGTITEAQLGNVPGLSAPETSTAQVTLKPGQQSTRMAPAA
jgi:hypothetical protein